MSEAEGMQNKPYGEWARKMARAAAEEQLRREAERRRKEERRNMMETTGTVPETPAPVGRTQELVLPVMDGVVQISAPRPLRAIDAERVAAGLRLLITDEQEEGAK